MTALDSRLLQSRRSLPSPNRPILIARLLFSSDPALAISDANVIDHELCKAFAFGPGRNWIGHGGSFRDFLLGGLGTFEQDSNGGECSVGGVFLVSLVGPQTFRHWSIYSDFSLWHHGICHIVLLV